MKYRARLFDPGNANAERPLEIFGNSLVEIERWAGEVLRNAVAPNAAVNVYQSIEQQIKILLKPKPEAKAS